MADPAEDRGDDLAAPDATLATDIPDEEARRDEQLAYYGGEKDELDDEDFMNVDRGDSLEPPELNDEEEEEEQAAEAEGDESSDNDESDDDDDAEPDTEETVADDEESDAEAGDEGDVAKSDDDDDEPQDKSGRDQRIPLSRFNEVNERMKAAERRLAELEKQEQAAEQAQEDAYDFDAAEAEYQELLLDGKTAEATAKRKEIRAAEHEIWKNEAKTESVREISQQESMRTLTALSSEAAELYPIFNDNHEHFDPVATQKVLTYMRGYVSSEEGMDASEAFVQALADVIDIYDLDTKYGYTEQEETPEEKPVAKKKAPKKQTKEKLEVAKKAAKSPAGQGRGSADAGAVVPDIEKLSDAEIDALPPETLARLRGDFVD